MDVKDILLIVLPVCTIVIGSLLTYIFTIKTKQNESMLKFKEEKYSNLIIALQGFIGITTSGKTKKIFFEEQYKSWLYASDEVTKAINKLIEVVTEHKGKPPEPQLGRELIGNIILEMRKDLKGKTNLTFKDFRYTDVIG